MISGHLYDETFKMWLEPGYHASRPPGEVHGPFKADGDVIVLIRDVISRLINRIVVENKSTTMEKANDLA